MILSIDTSSRKISVSLFKNNLYYTIYIFSKYIKSSKIFFLINNILKYIKKKKKNIKFLIFIKGPGSFTGIRISLCIAKTFYLIYKIPYIGISTAKCLKQRIWRKKKKKNILIIIYKNSISFIYIKYIKKKKKWIKKITKSKNAHILCKYIKRKWFLVNYTKEQIFCLRCKKKIKKNIFLLNTKDLILIILKYFNKNKEKHKKKKKKKKFKIFI